MTAQINADGIPQEFQNQKLWAVWKKDLANGKLRKIPKQPYNTEWEASWKSNSLETLPYCLKLLEMHPELGGLAYSIRPPYVFIDFDNCVVNGVITDEELLSDIARLSTYTEVSQSGKGLHVIGIGDGKPVPCIGGYDECYSEGHWIYITGNVYQEYYQVNNISSVLLQLVEERKDRVSPRSSKTKNLETVINGNFKTYEQCITEEYGLDCTTIGMPINPVNKGNGIWQGEHPFHGSSTGFNFVLDSRNNRFKCFRNHKTGGIRHGGGSGLELFAISEGLIDCEDAIPGWFDDKDLQKKVFKTLEDRGYTKKKDRWKDKFQSGWENKFQKKVL